MRDKVCCQNQDCKLGPYVQADIDARKPARGVGKPPFAGLQGAWAPEISTPAKEGLTYLECGSCYRQTTALSVLHS